MTREEFDAGQLLWNEHYKKHFGYMTEAERLVKLFPRIDSYTVHKYAAAFHFQDMYRPYVEYCEEKFKLFPTAALQAFSYDGPNRRHYNGTPVPCYKHLVLREIMRRADLILLGYECD